MTVLLHGDENLHDDEDLEPVPAGRVRRSA
jgi:hypothetical protein